MNAYDENKDDGLVIIGLNLQEGRDLITAVRRGLRHRLPRSDRPRRRRRRPVPAAGPADDVLHRRQRRHRQRLPRPARGQGAGHQRAGRDRRDGARAANRRDHGDTGERHPGGEQWKPVSRTPWGKAPALTRPAPGRATAGLDAHAEPRQPAAGGLVAVHQRPLRDPAAGGPRGRQPHRRARAADARHREGRRWRSNRPGWTRSTRTSAS